MAINVRAGTAAGIGTDDGAVRTTAWTRTQHVGSWTTTKTTMCTATKKTQTTVRMMRRNVDIF